MELVWGGDLEQNGASPQRQAMLQVFKETQEEKVVVNVVTNLKYFDNVGSSNAI